MTNTLSSVPNKDDVSKLVYGLARYDHWSTFKGPGAVYTRYNDYFNAVDIPKDKIANGFNKIKAAAKAYPTKEDDGFYADLVAIIEGDFEFTPVVRANLDKMIAKDNGGGGAAPLAGMGQQLGVVNAHRAVPPMQQLANAATADEAAATAAMITPRLPMKRQGNLKMDEDEMQEEMELIVAEKWTELTPEDFDGDFIHGDKFITQDADGRQVRLLFFLTPITGCFPIQGGKIAFENLEVKLNSAGDTLMIAFPKHKGVKKQKPYTTFGTKFYFEKNTQISKSEKKAMLHALDRQQVLLNIKETDKRPYHRTSIRLDFPCSVDDVHCVAIAGDDGFVALQIFLIAAMVRKSKVAKLQLLDVPADYNFDENSNDGDEE